VFRGENEDEIQNILPAEMQTPFTETEESNAVKSLKINKSAGCDNLRAEMINTAQKLYTEALQSFLIT